MIDLESECSAANRSQIKDFLRIVEKLKKSELLKPKKFPIKYELKFEETARKKQIITRTSQPNEGHLAISLYDVRQLFAQGEHTQLQKIYGTLGKILKDQELRATIGKMHRAFKESLKAESTSIRVLHEKGMSPGKALDLYFDGVYFHGNTQKRKELFGDFAASEPLVRVLFLVAVRNVIFHSILCRNFIHKNFTNLK